MPMSTSPRRALRAALATLVLATAPALVHAQSAARTIAGTYNFEVLSPNGAVKVVMTVRQEGQGHAGTLNADGFPTLQFSRITPNDSGALFEAEPGDGTSVVVAMKMAAENRIMGKVNYSGFDMPFTGTFTPAAPGAAPAAAAPAGPAVDPTGTYAGATLDPMLGQTSFAFECVISRGANGALGGGCGQSGNGPGEAPFSKVEVTGSQVKATGMSQVGMFSLEFALDGTTANGQIQLGGEKAKMRATFTPAKK
jgi:hypothetical protein